MVPTVAFPLGIPSTLQVTAVLEVPETVTLRETLSPVVMAVELGFTAKPTFTGGFEADTAAEAVPPPPPLHAINEQISPMARMPNRRT
jgi:hypothetical protein